MWFKVTMVLIALTSLALFVVGVRQAMIMIDGPSANPPAVSNATVERRIHLVMESRYDTNKPRRFVCREEGR